MSRVLSWELMSSQPRTADATHDVITSRKGLSRAILRLRVKRAAIVTPER
jgi:hypothetical protein